jgi:hypothetical protein
MNLWSSAILTALGGTIAIVGAWFGARFQAREARRARREAYDREDRFRLHKERVEAYSSFYIAAGHVRSVLFNETDQPTRISARSDLWATYTRIVLLGDLQFLQIAGSILKLADGVIRDGDTFSPEAFRELIQKLQRAGRADLIGAQDLAEVRPATAGVDIQAQQ